MRHMDDHLQVTNEERRLDVNAVVEAALAERQASKAALFEFCSQVASDLGKAHVVITMGELDHMQELLRLKEREAARYRGAMAKTSLLSLRPLSARERVARIQRADALATMDMARAMELLLHFGDALGERCLDRSVRLLQALREFVAADEAQDARSPDVDRWLEGLEDEWLKSRNGPGA